MSVQRQIHSSKPALRCRPSFEMLCIHANGNVVCSIMDGREDFVLGNVYEQSLPEILTGSRSEKLRDLNLSTANSHCRSIGKYCPLKTIPVREDEIVETRLKYLAIEPTTACNLKCLACPVRDFTSSVTWKHAYRDGGIRFFFWDVLRRTKQHAADAVRRAAPWLPEPSSLNRVAALFLRGRVRQNRSATMPISILKRIVNEAGSNIERVDLFSYGEPFLYPHLVDALLHIRSALPRARIAISTNGIPVKEEVEDSIVAEQLADCITFSVDGSDSESYRRYRTGGSFDKAFANLVRFHRKAQGTSVHIVWQYVMFRWNDSDEHLHRAIRIAEDEGLTLWFDITQSWGHSRRSAVDLRYLRPYLKPFDEMIGPLS